MSNHDELMSNFFAQADALAVGKSPIELRSENVPDALIPHKTFTGNRPSSSLMLPDLSAYTTGQILSLYEHITAVQVRLGFRVDPEPYTTGQILPLYEHITAVQVRVACAKPGGVVAAPLSRNQMHHDVL